VRKLLHVSRKLRISSLLLAAGAAFGQVGASPKDVLSPQAYDSLKKQEAAGRLPTAGQMEKQTAAIRQGNANTSAQLAAQLAGLTAQVNQLTALVSKQTDVSREVGILGLKVELLDAAKLAAETREQKVHDDNLGMWRSIGGGVITSVFLSGGAVVMLYFRGKRHTRETDAVTEQVGIMSDRVGIVSDTVDGVRTTVGAVGGSIEALNLKTNGMLERLLTMAAEISFRKGQDAERAHPTKP
jgi:hypothetical protein